MKLVGNLLGCFVAVVIMYSVWTVVESRPANKTMLNDTYTLVATRPEQLTPLLRNCLLDDVLTVGEYRRIKRAYNHINREGYADLLKELL